VKARPEGARPNFRAEKQSGERVQFLMLHSVSHSPSEVYCLFLGLHYH